MRGGCCQKIFPVGSRFIIIFGAWRRSGDWERIYQALRELERLRQGREKEASAGSLDSQSVKNVGGKQQLRGYDAGKKITGRKRHLLVDTLGLPIALKVTAASDSDQAGARAFICREQRETEELEESLGRAAPIVA